MTDAPPSGMIERLLGIIKGLTLSNVLVLGLVLAMLLPAYVGWKAVNNIQLLAVVMSQYAEIDSPTDCSLSFEQPAGTEAAYSIRYSFAQRNREAWYFTTRVRFKPDSAAMGNYCAVLQKLADYLVDPTLPVPDFPGSDRQLFYVHLNDSKEHP